MQDSLSGWGLLLGSCGRYLGAGIAGQEGSEAGCAKDCRHVPMHAAVHGVLTGPLPASPNPLNRPRQAYSRRIRHSIPDRRHPSRYETLQKLHGDAEGQSEQERSAFGGGGNEAQVSEHPEPSVGEEVVNLVGLPEIAGDFGLGPEREPDSGRK